jgi:APA family basic amino acid/polyamine antiporter
VSATVRDAGQVGLLTAIALVVGNMIGSGVFLLPASLAPYGGITLAGWIVSAGGTVCLALVFARLARELPAAGGPYAYTRRAFGDVAGFLVAWGYWISCWATNAALAVAFVGYLDPFFPDLVRYPPTAGLMAVAAIWVLTGVNAAGVRSAGRMQLVTTAIKVLPLLLVGFAGLALLVPSHFAVSAPDAPAVASDLMAVVTLTMFAFLGFEAATIPAAHVKNAARTIPRATVIGTLVAAAIYIGSTSGVMGVLDPDALARTTAPFAEAARVLFGAGTGWFVAFGAAVSCFGALNGWILMVGQVPLAAAQDGLFPPVFGRISRRGTPTTGMIVAGVLSTLLIGANHAQALVALYTFIILLSTLTALVAYVFCSLALFMGVRAEPARGPGTSMAVVSAVAFAFSLFAIAGSGMETVYWGFLMLVGGLPVYVWVVRRRPVGGWAR